ncbi:hypothetical protein HY479_04060 [Candidatus Uhrbacteria bacterium]|nr:hypothetical protein [Candidatus Uhrbacteria bacterium]
MDESDDRWRRRLNSIVFRMLSGISAQTFIASLPHDWRQTLKELVEDWLRQQDLQNARIPGSMPDREDSEEAPQLRLCWAVHTGKSTRELLGKKTDISNVGELIDAALHDASAEEFSGMVEPHTLGALAELLISHAAGHEETVRVRDASDDSVCGTLSPDQPFVILRVAERPSAPEAVTQESRSWDDGDEARHSTLPPPPVN